MVMRNGKMLLLKQKKNEKIKFFWFCCGNNMLEQYEEFYVSKTSIVTTFVSFNTMQHKLYHIQRIACNAIHHPGCEFQFWSWQITPDWIGDDKNGDDKKSWHFS